MGALRYLALGDSYTIGEGVDEAGRWPIQLASRLRDAGIDVAPPRIIATTGWTVDELAAGIAAAQPLGHWDVVSLGIGVNDQYRGHSPSDYRTGLVDLLDTVGHLAGDGGRVFMVSIPDWGVTRFARAEGRDAVRVADEIDEFNALARELCAARQIPFVDITTISRDGGDADAMLTGDGLHPSAAMYARWVDAVLPTAHRLLAGAT